MRCIILHVPVGELPQVKTRVFSAGRGKNVSEKLEETQFARSINHDSYATQHEHHPGNPWDWSDLLIYEVISWRADIKKLGRQSHLWPKYLKQCEEEKGRL